MPQFIAVNNNLGGWSDLAARAGDYRTARDQQDFALKQQAQDQSAYYQDQNLQRYDADRAARERIAMAGVDGRYGVANQNADAAMQRTMVSQGGLNDRNAANLLGRATQGELNRDSHEGIAGNRLQLGYDRIDATNTNAQLSREQHAAIAQANREHADVLAKARATEQAANRALAERRIDQQTYQRAVQRNIQEYDAQRRNLLKRVAAIQRAGETPNWGYVDAMEKGYAGQIAGQIAAPPPAAQPQPPAGFDTQSYQDPNGPQYQQPFYPGEGDPAQQQAAQPVAAPDGTVWMPTGQTGPDGKPIFQRVQ